MDTIYVSVEGIDVDEWRQTFEDELAQRLGPTKVSFFVPSVPGGAAAERGNRVGVCFKVSVNWAAVSVILQAVTLALSLIQPLPPTSPVPTVTCTIQGPNGSKTLEVRGAAVSEQAIDACLLDTGQPEAIIVLPTPSAKSGPPAQKVSGAVTKPRKPSGD